MLAMEEKILKEGKILPGGILKVGSFLNQQIDTSFLREIGIEVHRLFSDCNINKILTIESSGIAIATAIGLELDVPVVFAKKHTTSNVDGGVYCTSVHSFTHGRDYKVIVSSDYLTSSDTVLLVDDFLANGKALEGLISLCEQAGANIAGVAIAIEKAFQGGGDAIRARGIRIESLAMIESMDDDRIVFRH